MNDITITPPKEVTVFTMVFDEDSSNQFTGNEESDQFFLQTQERLANFKLINRKHVFLNEVLDSLGLQRTKFGVVCGWLIGEEMGDGYIDFGIEKTQKGSFVLTFNVDGLIWDKI